MYTYQLKNSNWDITNTILLQHQSKYSENEFKLLCDSVVPRAIDIVLLKEPNNDCIGWDDIISYISEILVSEMGFVKSNPVSVSYNGGIIWGSKVLNGTSNGFNVDKIIERNKEF